MIQQLYVFLITLLAIIPLYAADPKIPVDEPPLPTELQDALNTPPPEIVSPEVDQLYGEFFKMMMMLGFIIAFLFLIMWFIKRLLNTRIEQLNTSSYIKIIERRSLTPKTALYVVDVLDKRLILGESQNGINVLSEFSLPEEEGQEL
ncbi:MAG: flagellar biosynthetic protein FliO [Parachlamydiaceae bacterium]|nr:flagellar biosynthetic protein FliO [Parachlamydiaceae bacterium]